MAMLFERAQAIEAWAEDYFIDPNGVVYSQLDKATVKPPTNAFFEPEAKWKIVPGFTPAEFWSYENCGMTTGAYMQAMVCRYEVERDPAALQRARRSFQALKHIYGIGKQLEEGFFPKIYGGRFSDQTSTDQVLYAVLALDRYAPHADAQERREIAGMIAHMIQFWVKRGYRYKYFHIADMLWPLARFPSLLLLAYKHSGDAQFKVEYERLLAAGVNRHPGEERLRRKRNGEIKPSDYEQEQQAWLIGALADAVTMDVMELDYLLRNDPQNTWAATWRQSIAQMWREACLALAPNGKVYLQVLVDMDTGVARPPEPRATANISGATSGWSSMVARAGVQAAHHLTEQQAIIGEAQRVLHALDIHDLTYFDQPERFSPMQQYTTRFFSGDAMANWLWAYWQGRCQGCWRKL